jgi:hypothetical protein
LNTDNREIENSSRHVVYISKIKAQLNTALIFDKQINHPDTLLVYFELIRRLFFIVDCDRYGDKLYKVSDNKLKISQNGFSQKQKIILIESVILATKWRGIDSSNQYGK